MTLAVLCLTALLGAEGSSNDAIDAARDLLRRGRYAEAATALAGRSEAAARIVRGRALAALGRHAEALAALGDDQAAGIARAEILLATGTLAQAEALLGSLPPSIQSCRLRGDAFARMGELANARQNWEAAIPFYEELRAEDVEKTPPEFFVELGRALVGLNRFEEANEVGLAQAVERDRDNGAVLMFGAELFASKYDFPEARKYLRRALTAAPENPDALALMARTLLDDPGAGPNRLGEAKSLLARALAVNPRHEQALIMRGDAWYFDGLFEKALDSYRAALAANPSSLEALGGAYVVAHLRFRPQEMREAEAAARAVSRVPAAFYVAAAQRCDVQCQYPLGLASVRTARDIDPDYWPLYTSLALGELRAGNYARAGTAAKEGFARDPYNIWLNNTRKLLAHFDTAYGAEAWGDLVFHAPKKTLPFYVNYLGPLLAAGAELLKDRYGTSPPTPVHVEVYPRQDYFACRVLGLPDFPAQGVCFGPVIAVTVQPAFPGNHAISTWHEFTHVFTVTGSEYRVPRWLTEGISVREEGLCPMGGTRASFRALGMAVARGDIPALADFDQRFRRPRDAAEILNAYALCPLAVDLLIERHGQAVIPRILRGLREKEFPHVFREVTGVEVESFDRDWRAHVAAAGKDAAREFAGELSDPDALKARVDAGTATTAELADWGWALLARGREVDAESIALRLRADKAMLGDAAALLGFVALEQGKSADAAREFEAALANDTRNAFRVLAEQARRCKNAKDEEGYARALTAMWKRCPALAAEGGDHGALGTLCRHLAEKKAPELGAALADLAARSADAVWARKTLAQLRITEGNHAEAFKLLSQAAYIAPFKGPEKLDTELFELLIASAMKLDLQVEVARARKVLKECR